MTAEGSEVEAGSGPGSPGVRDVAVDGSSDGGRGGRGEAAAAGDAGLADAREAAIAGLVGAGESARGDRFTIDVLGIPSLLLMERAALAVAHEVFARWRPGMRVEVLCGPGNNGGDGLAMARQLHGWGVPVRAWLVMERHNAEVAEQLRMARALGVSVAAGSPGEAADAATIAVDALLGTGSTGAPRGAIAAGVAWLGEAKGIVVAIDIPTGVDPDRGAVPGQAVRADLTVTMQASKPGLHITPGRAHAGAVVVADIGLRRDPADAAGGVSLVGPRAVRRWLDGLPAGAHKGERGHVGVVGGSTGTPGAAVLAASAALRCGAGLVTVAASDPAVQALLVVHRPELMTQARVPGAPPVPAAGVLVVGPGLTRAEDRAGLGALWSEDPRPAVWDASALVDIPAGSRAGGPRVITPHPGEAAALLERLGAGMGPARAIQAERRRAAEALAERTGAVVVLKGEGTLVAEGGRLAIAVSGGPGLATAGSGDCLTGFVAALLARGLGAWEAACAGVHLHGVAGELAVAGHPGAVALEVADLAGRAFAAAGDVHPRMPRLRRA